MMVEDLQTIRMSDGCALKVKVLGDGPNKPLMIAHHGGPGVVSHMEPAAQFGAFMDSFRVLVFDCRGSGRSDKKRPYTHKQWVQDVEELRQWAGDEKFLMVGASHGGFLTLEYMLAYPQHLYGAIIGDTGAQLRWALADSVKTALTDPRVHPDPEQLIRVLTGNLKDEEDLLTGFASIQPLYSVPDDLKGQAETDLSAVLAEAVFLVWETVNAAMGDCLSRYDIRDRLHEIDVPVFVYVGRYDWITPVRLGQELAAGIRNSKFVVYEKSGHMPALEEKTAFQADAREFIKSLRIHGAA